MKQLWLSIFFSLVIHAALFSLNISRLKNLPSVTPSSSRITITLVSLQSLGDKKTSTPERLSEIAEKTLSTLEEESLSSPVVKQMPQQPTKRVPAPNPIMPPVEEVPRGITMKKELMIIPEVKPIILPSESIPQQTKIARETLIKKEMPEKKIKPKRSLKKLTKKKQKKESAKNVAPIKSIKTFVPKPAVDYRNIKRAELEQSVTRPIPLRSSKNINQIINSGIETTTESGSGSESIKPATRGDQSVKPARILMASPLYRRNPPPKYPRRARWKGYEGTVVLDVLVDESGTVKDLKVFESSGYELLDKSALTSVQKWLFTPGTKDGNPIGVWVRIPVRYKLK